MTSERTSPQAETASEGLPAGVSPNAASKILTAYVEFDGQLQSGAGVVSSGKSVFGGVPGVGQYVVQFDRNVSKGVYIASLGPSFGFGTLLPGLVGAVPQIVNATPVPDSVLVIVRDEQGTRLDHAFYLAVILP